MVPSLHCPAGQDHPHSPESLDLELPVSDVLLGNTLAAAGLAARASIKKTRSRGDGHLLCSGARANTACSSQLPSQGQGSQISMYCLKPSLHKPTGQKVSNFSSHPCTRQLPHRQGWHLKQKFHGTMHYTEGAHTCQILTTSKTLKGKTSFYLCIKEKSSEPSDENLLLVNKKQQKRHPCACGVNKRTSLLGNYLPDCKSRRS